MSDKTGTDQPIKGGTLLRAGRAMASAIFSRSGAGWARAPRRRAGRTIVLAVLATGAAAAAYAATTQSSAPVGNRAAIETVVRDYILEHPEIITEAMEKLKEKKTTALIDENRTALETPVAGAWEGAEKPDVTVVAFMDYACGYCRASLPDLAKLVQGDAKVRIVYRELPIIAEGSVPAARVSLYAAEAGKFGAFHRAMYAQGGVEKDKIVAAATKAGLDPAKVKSELENSARNPAIGESVRLAQSLEAQGTPLFVIGNQIFYGAVGYDTLKTAVDKARQRS